MKRKLKILKSWQKFGLVFGLILPISLLVGCQDETANPEEENKLVMTEKKEENNNSVIMVTENNTGNTTDVLSSDSSTSSSTSQPQLTSLTPSQESPNPTSLTDLEKSNKNQSLKPELNNESNFIEDEVSLDVKIGQMLIVGFRGFSLRDSGVRKIIQDIQRYHLGGVILFDYDVPNRSPRRNIRSPAQVKALVRRLQSAALQADPPIPLFIAIDQEGGKIQRLKREFNFPQALSAQALGQLSLKETYQQVENNIAKPLADMGINFNFAPVVDLNLNPNNPVIGQLQRSFSKDPQQVVQHALAFINAHHAHGVLCAIKHFPGHGSSTDDSHYGLVDVTETWQAIELEPYQSLIHKKEEDRPIIDGIITAHVFNRQLDQKWPATLSEKIIKGQLREKLGYQGVVISDDMQMGAISARTSREQALEKAIKAGIDMLIFGNNLRYEPAVVENTIVTIKQLVENQQLKPATITAAYQRISLLKTQWQTVLHQKYPLTIKPDPIESQVTISNAASKTYHDEMVLSLGQYPIEVQNPGYSPAHFSLLILDQPINLKVFLTPEQTLTSCPQNEYALTIDQPGTKVRILNIRPKYQPGMCLPAGWYDIEVTTPDYQTHRWWLKIQDTDLSIHVNLND